MQLFCLLLTASMCGANTLSTRFSGHPRSLCSCRLSNGHTGQSPSKTATPERWTFGRWEGRLWGKLRALGKQLEEGGPREGQTSPPCSQTAPRCRAVCKQAPAVTNEIQQPHQGNRIKSFCTQVQSGFHLERKWHFISGVSWII